MPGVGLVSGSRRLFFLLVWSMPAIVVAQTPETIASFYVQPSQAGMAAGAGEPDETFTFTAEVADARCFELDLGLNDGSPPLRATAEDGKAIFTHRYNSPRTFNTVLRAYREQDCSDAPLRREFEQVELPLNVVVRRPAVIPVNPPTIARFEARPDDSGRWNQYDFFAEVSGATRYDIDFGDDNEARELRPPPWGGAVRRPHTYTSAGNYSAELRATQSNGETIVIAQRVSVRRPVPTLQPAKEPRATAQQWPDASADVPPMPAQAEPDTVFLLLLLAGTIAALGLLAPGVPATDIVRFVPSIDRGRLATPEHIENVASMRVRWRGQPRFDLSRPMTVKKSRFKK